MSKSQALWALFMLIPLRTKVIFFHSPAFSEYKPVTNYLKKGGKIIKGISEIRVGPHTTPIHVDV